MKQYLIFNAYGILVYLCGIVFMRVMLGKVTPSFKDLPQEAKEVPIEVSNS